MLRPFEFIFQTLRASIAIVVSVYFGIIIYNLGASGFVVVLQLVAVGSVIYGILWLVHSAATDRSAKATDTAGDSQ